MHKLAEESGLIHYGVGENDDRRVIIKKKDAAVQQAAPGAVHPAPSDEAAVHVYYALDQKNIWSKAFIRIDFIC